VSWTFALNYETGTLIVSETVLFSNSVSVASVKWTSVTVAVHIGFRARARGRGRSNRLNREAELAVPRSQLVTGAPCTREAEALTRRDISARVRTPHVRYARRGDVDPEGRPIETGDLTGALEKRPLVGTRGCAERALVSVVRDLTHPVPSIAGDEGMDSA
jgi:hypothetical protein